MCFSVAQVGSGDDLNTANGQILPVMHFSFPVIFKDDGVRKHNGENCGKNVSGEEETPSQILPLTLSLVTKD